MKKAACLGLALLAFATVCATASNYPTRAINLIVGFPAGGPSDAIARVIAQSMSATLGRSIIVENINGAGGTLAAANAARARPDGYTVLLAHLGQATSVTFYRKLSYDPVGAFDPIGEIAEVPMVVVGRKDLPPRDIGELLGYIRANKDKLNYGNGGPGSGSHLCALLLMDRLQVNMTMVPYHGSGPAMNDLLGGQLDLLCDQTTTTIPQMKSGTIKGYAVTTKARVSAAPGLPTLDEAGLRGFELVIWYGLVVPKGTPKPIVDQLASALKIGLGEASVKKRLADFGAEPASEDRATPAGFGAYFRAEVVKWAPVIKAAGIYGD